MNDQSHLLSLFLRCLNAHYVHTPESGDYALQIEGDRLYLLFEWSDGREDWHHNLTFSAQKVNPDAQKDEQWYAHRGFLKVWNAMKEDVTEQVTHLITDHRLKALACVGYSHGAALALLATESLSRHLGKRFLVEGYGFGSPRVVWGNLSDAVRQHLKNYHTVRNIPDLVTYLPPAALGFRHVNLLTVGQKEKYSPVKAHTSQAYIDELRQKEAFSLRGKVSRLRDG